MILSSAAAIPWRRGVSSNEKSRLGANRRGAARRGIYRSLPGVPRPNYESVISAGYAETARHHGGKGPPLMSDRNFQRARSAPGGVLTSCTPDIIPREPVYQSSLVSRRSSPKGILPSSQSDKSVIVVLARFSAGCRARRGCNQRLICRSLFLSRATTAHVEWSKKLREAGGESTADSQRYPRGHLGDHARDLPAKTCRVGVESVIARDLHAEYFAMTCAEYIAAMKLRR